MCLRPSLFSSFPPSLEKRASRQTASGCDCERMCTEAAIRMMKRSSGKQSLDQRTSRTGARLQNTRRKKKKKKKSLQICSTVASESGSSTRFFVLPQLDEAFGSRKTTNLPATDPFLRLFSSISPFSCVPLSNPVYIPSPTCSSTPLFT